MHTANCSKVNERLRSRVANLDEDDLQAKVNFFFYKPLESDVNRGNLL